MKRERLFALLITVAMALSTVITAMTSAAALPLIIIPPTAPKDLISVNYASYVILSWEASVGLVSGYTLDRSDDGGITYNKVAKVNNNILTYKDSSYRWVTVSCLRF